jgi:hypothetical protein
LVFDFHADDIPDMTLTRAVNARQRIFSLVPDYDLGQAAGPLLELLERLAEQTLRYR